MVSERLNRSGADWLLNPGGMAVAFGVALGMAAVVLARLSVIWSMLFVVGLAVMVCSLAARDAKSYWLVIFVLVLPLEIDKMLIDSGYVMERVKRYGFPTGELPGPVLHLSDLPLLVLLTLWITDTLLHRKPIRFPKAHWLALALLGWSALSILNARDFASAFFDLCRGAKLYVLYLLAYNILGDPKRVRWVVIALLAGVALQGALCLTQFVSQDAGRMLTSLLGKKNLYSTDLKNTMGWLMRVSEGSVAGKRASGTVGPINAQAFYFEQLLPLAFLIWLVVRRSAERYLAILAAVLGSLGLLVTFSRGGMLGLLCGMLCLVVLAWRRNAVPRQRLALIALSGLILLVVALPLMTRYFGSRPEAATGRLHLMAVGLRMVHDHPLLGVGLNNHLQARADYDLRAYMLQMPTHNHFILLASQIGIPGLILFLAFLWSIWRSALQAAASHEPLLVAVALGTAAALVALAVHSQVDYIGTHTSLTLLWLFAGLVAALKDRVAADAGRLRANTVPDTKAVNG